jgi:hypothetical protein
MKARDSVQYSVFSIQWIAWLPFTFHVSRFTNQLCVLTNHKNCP